MYRAMKLMAQGANVLKWKNGRTATSLYRSAGFEFCSISSTSHHLHFLLDLFLLTENKNHCSPQNRDLLTTLSYMSFWASA